MQNNYCQAEDGGSHGIAIGIAIGDRLSRQFDLVPAGADFILFYFGINSIPRNTR